MMIHVKSIFDADAREEEGCSGETDGVMKCVRPDNA